jgi:hypothetical protein
VGGSRVAGGCEEFALCRIEYTNFIISTKKPIPIPAMITIRAI